MSPAAAWVPEQLKRDQDDDARMGIDWIEDQSRHLGVGALLLTETRDGKTYTPSLSDFAARQSHDTPRARSVRGPKAVLAHVPTRKVLDMAMGLARDTAICVIEGFATPVAGWAAQMAAIDLTSPEAPPTVVPPALQKAVDRLVFYGNNGYGPPFDRDRAVDVLRDLLAKGLLSADWLATAVLARHVSARGADRLYDLAVTTV